MTKLALFSPALTLECALGDADDGGLVKEQVQRLSNGADVTGLEQWLCPRILKDQ